MNACKTWRLIPAAVTAAIFLTPAAMPIAHGFDVDFDGFIRTELAAKMTSDENVFNQRGNLFNGKSVDRLGLNLATGEFVSDTVVRGVPPADNDFNMILLRGELGMNARFTDQLRLRMQLRAVFDPNSYSNFNPASLADSDPAGPLQGKPNLFDYRVDSGGVLQGRKNPAGLEFSGERYLIDFPSLYLDYQSGPLNVRFGNQQIAWGQSLFFRVLDVPNGLDLRRHGLLDYVPEEFSDKRVPSPAIRASYTFGQWEVDGFVQHFRPSIYGNPNTPYNVIPAAFTVHDMYGDVDREFNFGTRMRGPLGPFQAQLIAVRRYGSEGTFRWTESGVNRDIPGLPGSGLVLEQTAFEVDPSGVNSAEEWYTYAALARLDARDGLNSAIEEFPAAALLGAAPVGSDLEARVTLDTFFQLSGGLRGHIAREYHRENVFGGGLSYVFEGAPDTLLDQLIANFEVQFADGRVFTNPTLSRQYIEADEWTFSLVLEKYHRFSRGFPATYVVAQAMHKTESDIFGRYLGGMGGSNDVSALDAKSPGSANYLAFAVQQPFPNLVWRFDLSLLYDTEGGLLSQAGIRWRPRGAWMVEAFYTRVDGNLRGRNPNLNALSTAAWADEVTLRVGYQF